MFRLFKNIKSLKGVKKVNGKWLVNGRTFDQMNAFERQRLVFFIHKHKTAQMEGLVSIPELLQHMKRENLVIVPAHLVMKEQTNIEVLRKKMLSKKSLTYSEISKAKLWGDITQKRVYVIAKEFAKELEIIKPGNKCNSPEKIMIGAVVRIAKQRNTYEN